MIILSLDPSTAATGWAIFNNGIIEVAGYEPFESEEFHGDTYVNAADWLKHMILCVQPDLILIEDFFFSRRFAAGSPVNVELRGVYKLICRSYSVPYEVISPSDWKRSLVGRVKPTKEEIKKHGKEKAKKIMTVEKLEEMGLHCPDKVINFKTKRDIGFKYDVSDAIGILIHHLRLNKIDFEFGKDIWNFEVAESNG